MDLSKFKAIFISEVEDQLQKLNTGVLLLEKLNNKGEIDTKTVKDTYNEMMRASHTIKGSSASMGFVKMAFLTHILEDVFDAARNNRLKLNEKMVNLVFKSIDNIENSLNNIKENDEELDFDNFSKKLKKETGVQTEGIGKSKRNEDGGPVELTMQEQPTTSDINQESELDKEQQTESNLEKIEESAITKIDYIKVPVKRLDSLLDLVEELLINRMHIEEISQRNPELKNVFSHMDMLISGIQFEVTQSRLVPVEQAFARFPRMIRDLSQKENKKINFEVSGGEIELDRSVVDKLGEPLIHLLRNAVDHGITEEGKINLSAIRKSERVQFVVENIGEKINIEKIKKVALSKGLVTTQTISEMKESAIIDFIFHPNFSTKDHVTEISGRGVGLNVVKKFADSFNGRILAENTDKGARFILELPQTLAIIETLLVEVNKSIFAIPFTDIERSVKVYNTDIKRMADRDMGVIDGTNIPLIDLSESFKYVDAIKKVVHVKNSEGKKISNSELTNPEELKTTENQEKAIKKDHKLVVLVKKEEGMAGIVVDSLITEQEVIVKPFTSMLQNIKEFSGSTILGDGRVVLILDVLNIIKTLNKL